jgi:alkylation response protein AidB-like acyl-CoA dehydrogenase
LIIISLLKGRGTETIAVPIGSDVFKLYGYKWFSSATDADIALTLARIADKDGNVIQGTPGLTLFLVKLRDDYNQLNNIDIIRLKDKLGTRQVPTAELLLDGTVATQVISKIEYIVIYYLIPVYSRCQRKGEECQPSLICFK